MCVLFPFVSLVSCGDCCWCFGREERGNFCWDLGWTQRLACAYAAAKRNAVKSSPAKAKSRASKELQKCSNMGEGGKTAHQTKPSAWQWQQYFFRHKWQHHLFCLNVKSRFFFFLLQESLLSLHCRSSTKLTRWVDLKVNQKPWCFACDWSFDRNVNLNFLFDIFRAARLAVWAVCSTTNLLKFTFCRMVSFDAKRNFPTKKFANLMSRNTCQNSCKNLPFLHDKIPEYF